MITPNESFDPSTVALMGRAYDSAVNDLKRAGIRVEDTAKFVMANRILGAVSSGELNINRLMQYALAAINAPRSPASCR